jgi:hypothetical protein
MREAPPWSERTFAPFGGLANVTAQHGYVVPELTRGRLQSRRTLPDDYDGPTFLPKQLRSFKSDAGGSARNEDNFVRQSHELSPGPIPRPAADASGQSLRLLISARRNRVMLFAQGIERGRLSTHDEYCD